MAVKALFFTPGSRTSPDQQPAGVVRPKGAELSHPLPFFLAGRSLGALTSPETACFHSKPDVSSLAALTNAALIDSASLQFDSCYVRKKQQKKKSTNPAGGKCSSFSLSFFLSLFLQLNVKRATVSSHHLSLVLLKGSRKKYFLS